MRIIGVCGEPVEGPTKNGSVGEVKHFRFELRIRAFADRKLSFRRRATSVGPMGYGLSSPERFRSNGCVLRIRHPAGGVRAQQRLESQRDAECIQFFDRVIWITGHFRSIPQ